MADHPIYRELERVTGVHIEFVHADGPSYQQLVALLTRASAKLSQYFH